MRRRFARSPWRYLIALPLGGFVLYGMWSLPNLLMHWQPPFAGVLIASIAWLLIALGPIVLLRRGATWLAGWWAVIGMIALRVPLGLLVAGHIPPGDADMYLLLADNLRLGRGFEVFEPFMGVETRALFPPLYPALLALWEMVAGPSTASLLVFSSVIDLLAGAVIVLLAATLGDRRAGLVAAWLYLIWPSTLLSAPLAQKEGLCVLLTLILALQWVRYVQAPRPSARDAAMIGVAAGLLALTQPGVLPLAALFGIVALGTGVRRLLVVSLAAVPVAAAAVMLPWWARNLSVFDSFVPLTSAGGYGLWVGNNPDADGHWMPPPASLHGLPEIAFGRAAGRIAVEWIVSHPLDFARVTVAKALRGWGIAEFGASRLANLKPAVNQRVSGALFAVSQLLHLGLMAVAAFRTSIARTPGSRMLLLLVLACIIQTLCFGAFFEFGERHREFATPFLLLLAFWGSRDPARSSALEPLPR